MGRHRNRRTTHLAFLAFWVLALCAFVFGSAQAAERARVVLVIDQHHAIYDELVDSLRLHLEPHVDAPVVSVITLSDTPPDRLFTKATKRPDLIITAGTVATARVSQLDTPAPVLSVLIPKASVDDIRRRSETTGSASRPSPRSAIYLDQPLGRRLDLIRLLLPNARRIGVVLGPGNEDLEQELGTESNRRRLQLDVRRVSANDNLIAVLDQVLERNEVLLGIVDSVVFNRASAQNVLMTAYRHRVPLIGVSPAYVKAGALAAVYSTPAQVGRQLAELLAAPPAVNMPWTLAAAQYPKYFSVAVNRHIAQSLDLVVDNEERLADKLSAHR